MCGVALSSVPLNFTFLWFTLNLHRRISYSHCFPIHFILVLFFITGYIFWAVCTYIVLGVVCVHVMWCKEIQVDEYTRNGVWKGIQVFGWFDLWQSRCTQSDRSKFNQLFDANTISNILGKKKVEVYFRIMREYVIMKSIQFRCQQVLRQHCKVRYNMEESPKEKTPIPKNM